MTAKTQQALARGTYGLNEAKETIEVCQVAGASLETALGFMQAGTPLEAVRKTLLLDNQTGGWATAFGAVHGQETPHAP